MKYALSIALILSIGLFSSQAQDYQFEKSTETMKKVKATIQINGTIIVALDQNDDSKRYILTNLPEEYQVNGLEIQFSGVLGTIPPNYRLAGSPVKLTLVKACPGYEKLGVKTKSYRFD